MSNKVKSKVVRPKRQAEASEFSELNEAKKTKRNEPQGDELEQPLPMEPKSKQQQGKAKNAKVISQINKVTTRCKSKELKEDKANDKNNNAQITAKKMWDKFNQMGKMVDRSKGKHGGGELNKPISESSDDNLILPQDGIDDEDDLLDYDDINISVEAEEDDFNSSEDKGETTETELQTNAGKDKRIVTNIQINSVPSTSKGENGKGNRIDDEDPNKSFYDMGGDNDSEIIFNHNRIKTNSNATIVGNATL